MKLEDMSISSECPSSVEQVYAALVALQAAPVVDPQLRPDGPCEVDRLRLLGSLLAKTELEITAATRLAGDGVEIEDIFDAVIGWSEQVGPDAGIAADVLVNRMERSAIQVAESDSAELPPGREASFAAAMAAAFSLTAQLQLERGDVDGTRQALSAVEAALIDILTGVHALRVAIGDAQKDDEE